MATFFVSKDVKVFKLKCCRKCRGKSKQEKQKHKIINACIRDPVSF